MKLHTPKKGDTFTLGFGLGGKTCDVTKVSKGNIKTVEYTVRSDSSKRHFVIGSPTHKLAKWWGN